MEQGSVRPLDTGSHDDRAARPHDRVLHGRRLDGRVRLRNPGGKGGDRARGRSARAIEGGLPDQWRPRGGASAHQYRLRGRREEGLVRVTTRLVLAIWVTALAVVASFAYLQVSEERQRMRQELERRASLLGEGLQDGVETALSRSSRPALERLLKRFGRPGQRLAVYDTKASLVALAPESFVPRPETAADVTAAITRGSVRQVFRKLG